MEMCIVKPYINTQISGWEETGLFPVSLPNFQNVLPYGSRGGHREGRGEEIRRCSSIPPYPIIWHFQMFLPGLPVSKYVLLLKGPNRSNNQPTSGKAKQLDFVVIDRPIGFNQPIALCAVIWRGLRNRQMQHFCMLWWPTIAWPLVASVRLLLRNVPAWAQLWP